MSAATGIVKAVIELAHCVGPSRFRHELRVYTLFAKDICVPPGTGDSNFVRGSHLLRVIKVVRVDVAEGRLPVDERLDQMRPQLLAQQGPGDVVECFEALNGAYWGRSEDVDGVVLERLVDHLQLLMDLFADWFPIDHQLRIQKAQLRQPRELLEPGIVVRKTLCDLGEQEQRSPEGRVESLDGRRFRDGDWGRSTGRLDGFLTWRHMRRC